MQGYIINDTDGDLNRGEELGTENCELYFDINSGGQIFIVEQWNRPFIVGVVSS